MGNCCAPATAPPEEGSCNHGLLAARASEFDTVQLAGLSWSVPCITRVATTCSTSASGFDRATDTLSEMMSSSLNRLGEMHPEGTYGAWPGVMETSSNSGLGQVQLRLLRAVPFTGRASHAPGADELHTLHDSPWVSV
eukprot:7389356-Prymnesium_polylepis.2